MQTSRQDKNSSKKCVQMREAESVRAFVASFSNALKSNSAEDLLIEKLIGWHIGHAELECDVDSLAAMARLASFRGYVGVISHLISSFFSVVKSSPENIHTVFSAIHPEYRARVYFQCAIGSRVTSVSKKMAFLSLLPYRDSQKGFLQSLRRNSELQGNCELLIKTWFEHTTIDFGLMTSKKVAGFLTTLPYWLEIVILNELEKKVSSKADGYLMSTLYFEMLTKLKEKLLMEFLVRSVRKMASKPFQCIEIEMIAWWQHVLQVLPLLIPKSSQMFELAALCEMRGWHDFSAVIYLSVVKNNRFSFKEMRKFLSAFPSALHLTLLCRHLAIAQYPSLRNELLFAGISALKGVGHIPAVCSLIQVCEQIKYHAGTELLLAKAASIIRDHPQTTRAEMLGWTASMLEAVSADRKETAFFELQNSHVIPAENFAGIVSNLAPAIRVKILCKELDRTHYPADSLAVWQNWSVNGLVPFGVEDRRIARLLAAIENNNVAIDGPLDALEKNIKSPEDFAALMKFYAELAERVNLEMFIPRFMTAIQTFVDDSLACVDHPPAIAIFDYVLSAVDDLSWWFEFDREFDPNRKVNYRSDAGTCIAYIIRKMLHDKNYLTSDELLYLQARYQVLHVLSKGKYADVAQQVRNTQTLAQLLGVVKATANVRSIFAFSMAQKCEDIVNALLAKPRAGLAHTH